MEWERKYVCACVCKIDLSFIENKKVKVKQIQPKKWDSQIQMMRGKGEMRKEIEHLPEYVKGKKCCSVTGPEGGGITKTFPKQSGFRRNLLK